MKAALAAIAIVATLAVSARAGEVAPVCLAAAERWLTFVEVELAEWSGLPRVNLTERDEHVRQTAAGWSAFDLQLCQDLLVSPDSVVRALARASIGPFDGDPSELLPLVERLIENRARTARADP